MEKDTTYHTTIREDPSIKGVVFMQTRTRTTTDAGATRIGPAIPGATRIAPVDTLIADIKQDKHSNSRRRGWTALGMSLIAGPAMFLGAWGGTTIAKERTITPEVIIEAGLTLAGIIAAKGLHMYLERLRQRTALLESQWIAVVSEQYPATCNLNPR